MENLINYAFFGSAAIIVILFVKSFFLLKKMRAAYQVAITHLNKEYRLELKARAWPIPAPKTIEKLLAENNLPKGEMTNFKVYLEYFETYIKIFKYLIIVYLLFLALLFKDSRA